MKRTPFWLWTFGAMFAAIILHAIGGALDMGGAWTVLVVAANAIFLGYLCAARARDAGKENVALWVVIGVVVPFGILVLGCAPSTLGQLTETETRAPDLAAPAVAGAQGRKPDPRFNDRGPFPAATADGAPKRVPPTAVPWVGGCDAPKAVE